jgi:hypothetical protein
MANALTRVLYRHKRSMNERLKCRQDCDSPETTTKHAVQVTDHSLRADSYHIVGVETIPQNEEKWEDASHRLAEAKVFSRSS